MDWIFIWQWITVDAFRKKKKKLDDTGGGMTIRKGRHVQPSCVMFIYGAEFETGRPVFF
jgi:hypothetical protein